MWLYGAALLMFGVLLPWLKGLDLLDPLLFLMYGLLGVALTGPLALRLAPGPAVAMGWGGGLLTLAVALATVNATHRFGTLLLPGKALLTATVLLSLAGCVLVAGTAALLQRRTQNARAALRGFLLALLLAFLVCQRVYPEAIPGWLTEEGLRRLTWTLTPLLLLLGGALQWAAAR